MADQHLGSMSIKRLRLIGTRLGINDVQDLLRDELIETIEDILEERLDDRLKNNNEVMSLKGKKFDLFDDLCTEAVGEPVYELPDFYADTSVHMMLRDPYWAFVYWNVNPKDLEVIKEQHGEVRLVLRIHEFSHPRLPLSKCKKSFDISVKEDDTSWYVNLLELSRWYVASLVAQSGNWSETLCSSNEIYSPGGYWLERIQELKANQRELDLFHAAVTDLSGHEVDSILVQTILEGLGRQDDKEQQS